MKTTITRSGDSVHLETADVFRTLTLDQFAKHARDPDFCADLPVERTALVAEATVAAEAKAAAELAPAPKVP